jgi:DNA-binding IclR family transcriptional regulator
VTRPALSASRSIDVIDFLSAFPRRGFTLSEIARAAKINTSSCHAVLSALTDRGYLTRSSNQRYFLGPSLVAVGQAALVSQPLIARAKEAAETLFQEFGVPVLLSAAIGEEIVGIVSIADSSGRGPGLRVGERLPLVAPVGAPFLAWSPEAAIETWIARNALGKSEKVADEWRRALALTRKRGFQVTLRAPDGPVIASLMAEMASGRRISEYKDEVLSLIHSFDHHLSQPEIISPDELYDIVLIASPLFDQNGEAAFNLCFGGFSEKVSGATIQTYADRLMRTCLQIMRDDRT